MGHPQLVGIDRVLSRIDRPIEGAAGPDVVGQKLPWATVDAVLNVDLGQIGVENASNLFDGEGAIEEAVGIEPAAV